MAQRSKRFEFSETQRAEVFARDRATCVYSGKSLWLLDYGACPLFEWNWVDHVKPSRRGGKADHSNGVYASYTYNAKKRANGADNFFWIDPDLNGKPSESCFYYFGTVTPQLANQLVRLANIEPTDWYFNQAASHLMLACFNSVNGVRHKRTPAYWARSAAKMLGNFRARGGTAESILHRELVLFPNREDVMLLLSLTSDVRPTEFRSTLKRLKAIYAANHLAMQEFWAEETASGMNRKYRKAAKNSDISPAVLEAMKSFVEFWQRDPRN